MGKALGTLRRMGVPSERLKPNWDPTKVYFKPPSGRDILILEWTNKDGYGIKETNLSNTLPEIEAAVLLQRLRI